MQKRSCRYCEHQICGLHISLLCVLAIVKFAVFTLPIMAMAWKYLGLNLWPW